MEFSLVISALAYALLEWLLILFLFLHAIFSYLITKFSSYFELQAPCLLCSRVEHIFGQANPHLYMNLFCRAHKLEISSIVCCKVHEKLADGQWDCKTCLCPLPTKKSHHEKSKSLVEGLCEDLEFRVENGYLVAEHVGNFSSSKYCCSNSLHRSTTTAHKLSDANLDITELEVPKLNADNNGCKHIVVDSPKGHGKLMISSMADKRNAFFPGNGYSELKILRYSDVDIDSSDNSDDENMVVPEVHTQNKEFPSDICASRSFSSVQATLTNQMPVPRSVSNSGDLSHVDSSRIPENLSTIGLMERTPHRADQGCQLFLSTASAEFPVAFEEKSPKMKMDISNRNCGNIAVAPKPRPNVHALPCSVSLDLNDTYKWVSSDHSALNELNILEDSFGQLEERHSIPWNSSGPKMQRHVSDGNDLELSISSAPASLCKRLSIERNGSGFDSLVGSIVSEIDAEGIVYRLKHQIQQNKKAMVALYKELEAERNASAIAANQAMAMINRLQEEKATMQMEALQYQRMMEEQAEYDQQALHKANELLSRREKELYDLDEKYASYRRRHKNETAEKLVNHGSDSGEAGFMSFVAEKQGNAYACNAVNVNLNVVDLECDLQRESSCAFKHLKILKDRLSPCQDRFSEAPTLNLDENAYSNREGETNSSQEFGQDEINMGIKNMMHKNENSHQKQAAEKKIKCQSAFPDFPGEISCGDLETTVHCSLRNGPCCYRNEISLLTQCLNALETDGDIIKRQK